MSAIFKQHINKFVELDDAAFADILPFFYTIECKKKETLLKEGQFCKTNYFVLKGYLRRFFINEKGIEQTTEFALENWWMTDNMAYGQQQPAAFSIQAVEPSTLLSINYQEQEKMFKQYPLMERYFRCIYQRAYAASQRRTRFLYEHSKEENYHFFNSKYPEFVQRVPQYLLASFLGFTPEYLSEIRKKKRS
jgi:CRP-like cAMP-binding protein